MYCCFLVGDDSLNSLVLHNEERAGEYADKLPRYIQDMAANNPQMGAYCNGRFIYGFYETRDGSYFRANMDLRIENASLSNEEIYRQQNEAMEAAYAISKQLHDSGKIKSGMSQKEIAQVYYDYLQKLGVKIGDVGFGAKNPGENMKYQDCNLLAYSLVGPNKKNDGKLIFTVCNYSVPEEIEAARAANKEADQKAVKVDASAFTQTNHVLKADMSKLPEGVKDFKYFARGGKSGNAVTEEQAVRSAMYKVESDPLKDTDYSPILPYGASTGGANPLKSGSVLLLYDANKVLVGYSLIP